MKRGSLTSSPKTRRSSEIAARQHVVADKGVGPDRPHQAFFGHDLTGLRGKAHEHLHHLGFQASGAGGARHAVEGRLDVMEVADAEVVLQGSAQCVRPRVTILLHGLGAVGQHPDVALPGPSCDGQMSAVLRITASPNPERRCRCRCGNTK